MTYHVQFPGLGLEFTLDRVAFTVFGMPIYWYGILIATRLALAIVFAFSHARRFGIDSDRMVDVILIDTVCAVIGGRAFYVATAPFEYASFAEMLDIRLGGVAIYGAVIAAFLSGYFACRWRKVPILPMFDLAGMGFLLKLCQPGGVRHQHHAALGHVQRRHLQLPLKRAGNAGRAGRCGGPVPAGAPYVFV